MPHHEQLCPLCGICAGHHSPVGCPLDRVKFAPSMYCLDAMTLERGSHWGSRERRRLNETRADLWLEYQEWERAQAREQQRHRHDRYHHGGELMRGPRIDETIRSMQSLHGGHGHRHSKYDHQAHGHPTYDRTGRHRREPRDGQSRDPYDGSGHRRHGHGLPDDRPHGQGHRGYDRFAAPGYGRRDHRNEHGPRYRSPSPLETDQDLYGGVRWPPSDIDSRPAPRHGDRQPGHHRGGHRPRPRPGFDPNGDLPKGGHGNFHGGSDGGFPGGLPGHGDRPGGRRGGFRPGFPGAEGAGAPQDGPTEPEEPKPDFYEVLGVPKTATVEECVKAARRKLIELHPDKHPEDRDDPVKVKHWNDGSAKVREAQLTIGNAAKKARYDEQLRFGGLS